METPICLIKNGIPTVQASMLPDVQEVFDCLKNNSRITLQTSGTTGEPSLISFAAEQLILSAQNTLNALHLNPGARFLLCIPARFVGGKMMIVRAFLAKADLWYLPPSLRPFQFTSQHFHFVALSPAQVIHSLRHPEETQKMKTVDVLLIGGGSLPPGVEAELQTFPNLVRHSYGMTETLSHCALKKIAPECEQNFEAHAPGIIFERDERDCLRIFYPGITQGFIQTQDVAELHNGQFTIKGRVDDVINMGGLKLFPEWYHRQFPEHFLPGQKIVVRGMPDAEYGAVPWLWIEGPEIPEELIHFLSQQFRGKERIRGVCLCEKLPRTETGKIINGALPRKNVPGVRTLEL